MWSTYLKLFSSSPGILPFSSERGVRKASFRWKGYKNWLPFIQGYEIWSCLLREWLRPLSPGWCCHYSSPKVAAPELKKCHRQRKETFYYCAFLYLYLCSFLSPSSYLVSCEKDQYIATNLKGAKTPPSKPPVTFFTHLFNDTPSCPELWTDKIVLLCRQHSQHILYAERDFRLNISLQSSSEVSNEFEKQIMQHKRWCDTTKRSKQKPVQARDQERETLLRGESLHWPLATLKEVKKALCKSPSD